MKRKDIEKINETIELLREHCRSNDCDTCVIGDWCETHTDDGIHCWEPIEIEFKSIYELERGDTYWYQSPSDLIKWTVWQGGPIDRMRLEDGNVYITMEDAEMAKKTLGILRRHSCIFSNKEREDMSVYKYRMIYNHHPEVQDIVIAGEVAMHEKGLSFRSKEDIERAINEAGRENVIKYYFDVNR